MKASQGPAVHVHACPQAVRFSIEDDYDAIICPSEHLYYLPGKSPVEVVNFSMFNQYYFVGMFNLEW